MKTKKKSKGTKTAKNPNMTWHEKIAANRGEEWLKNLRKGKQEAQQNPSLIKIARLKIGLDQVKMAEELELQPSTYGSIERGKQKVKPMRARQIAKILKMPVEKLFSETISTNSKKQKYVAILKKLTI